LLYGRHSVAAAAVRAVLRLDRDAPGRVHRLHTPSGFGVDDPAGPQPADGSRRPRQPTAGLDPRSRSEGQPRLRRHLPQRKHPDHPYADPGAQRECPRGTLGRQRAPGVPRPAPDLRPPPARARPPRLHRPLQPAASSPSTRPAPTGSPQRNRSVLYSDGLSAADHATRPPRRPTPRIRSRSMKTEFVHPTGFAARFLHEAVILGDRHRLLIHPESGQLDLVRMELTHPVVASDVSSEPSLIPPALPPHPEDRSPLRA